MAHLVKSACNEGDLGSIPWSGRFLGEGNSEIATHSSILVWRIPWTEEPGGLQSMRSQRVRHDLVIQQQQRDTTEWLIFSLSLFMDTESRFVVVRGWKEGVTATVDELLLMEIKFLFEGRKMSCVYTKTIYWYNIKWLKWWILSYMIYPH